MRDGRHWRVGWYADAELGDPLLAVEGWLLRQELARRSPRVEFPLVAAALPDGAEPGLTGEWVTSQFEGLDALVISASPPGSLSLTPGDAGGDRDVSCDPVVVAAHPSWGADPAVSVGAPFACPEPMALARRHLLSEGLHDRQAYLRLTDLLPERYVLVEGDAEHLSDWWPSLAELASSMSAVLLPLPKMPTVWDIPTTVSGAQAVVATSSRLLALAWSFGIPHVGLDGDGDGEDGIQAFRAWTGDDVVVRTPDELDGALPAMLARRGSPPGLRRIEATVDVCLDEAAKRLQNKLEHRARIGDDQGFQPSMERWVREVAERNAILVRQSVTERHAVTSMMDRHGEKASSMLGMPSVEDRPQQVMHVLVEDAEARAASLQAEIMAVQQTRSWRVMAPARAAYGGLLRKRLG